MCLNTTWDSSVGVTRFVIYVIFYYSTSTCDIKGSFISILKLIRCCVLTYTHVFWKKKKKILSSTITTLSTYSCTCHLETIESHHVCNINVTKRSVAYCGVKLWRMKIHTEACTMTMFWFTYFIHCPHQWIYAVYNKSITKTTSGHSIFTARFTCLVCFHATKTPQSLISCQILNTVCSLVYFVVFCCVIAPIDTTSSHHGNLNHTIAPVNDAILTNLTERISWVL